MNLSKNIKITMALAAQTSAGTALDSASVDMQGFEGVLFIGTVAAANAGNFANIAQSNDDSSFNDLEGTKVVPGDNGDSFLIDVYKPTDRYIRCEIDRSGTNTATGDIYAVQYGGTVLTGDHGSTIDSELHISPDEGTP